MKIERKYVRGWSQASVISETAHFSQLLWPVKSSDSMHDLLFLVLFWFISPHAMAGTVYQFPPSVKVKSGDTVTMHCQLNEVQSFCHTVAWVRVNPVSGIIDILQDANISSQTKDVDENPVCQASIYNAAVQDSGTYYCIATDRELMYVGNGTAVNVHADNTVMPSVDIVAFASSNNHVSSVTLQCTVKGSAPSQVFVYWLIGSRKENGQTLVVWEEGEENSLNTQNNVVVSAKEWKTEGQCICVVKFGGWMFNTTLHHYDIQDTCYPLISVTRFFTLVTALLFFMTSLILARRRNFVFDSMT